MDKALITDILARTCKVNALAMKEDDTTALESLHERISSRIYGQEEASVRWWKLCKCPKPDCWTKTNRWQACSL